MPNYKENSREHQQQVLKSLIALDERMKSRDVESMINSKYYQNIQTELTAVIGVMDKALKKKNGFVPEEEFQNMMDNLYDLSEKYIKHKEVDGTNKNAELQLDAVKDLRALTDEDGFRHDIHKIADTAEESLYGFLDIDDAHFRNHEATKYIENAKKVVLKHYGAYWQQKDGKGNYDLNDLDRHIKAFFEEREKLVRQIGKDTAEVQEHIDGMLKPAATEEEKDKRNDLVLDIAGSGSQAAMRCRSLDLCQWYLQKFLDNFDVTDRNGNVISVKDYVKRGMEKAEASALKKMTAEEKRYHELGSKALNHEMWIGTLKNFPKSVENYYYDYSETNRKLLKNEILDAYSQGLEEEGIPFYKSVYPFRNIPGSDVPNIKVPAEERMTAETVEEYSSRRTILKKSLETLARNDSNPQKQNQQTKARKELQDLYEEVGSRILKENHLDPDQITIDACALKDAPGKDEQKRRNQAMAMGRAFLVGREAQKTGEKAPVIMVNGAPAEIAVAGKKPEPGKAAGEKPAVKRLGVADIRKEFSDNIEKPGKSVKVDTELLNQRQMLTKLNIARREIGATRSRWHNSGKFQKLETGLDNVIRTLSAQLDDDRKLDKKAFKAELGRLSTLACDYLYKKEGQAETAKMRSVKLLYDLVRDDDWTDVRKDDEEAVIGEMKNTDSKAADLKKMSYNDFNTEFRKARETGRSAAKIPGPARNKPEHNMKIGK